MDSHITILNHLLSSKIVAIVRLDSAGAVGLGVGGKLVDKNAVKRGDWAALTAEAQRLVAAEQ